MNIPDITGAREAETPKQRRDELCVNTIRTLSMDAVQRANSGHPGTPMAMAPVAYCLILSRQPLPTFDRTRYAPASGLARGAYVLADSGAGLPDVVLLASASEVSLCVAAYEKLKADGIRARVVSVPSWELFDQQDQQYRDSVIPPTLSARVAVEQASTFGWERFVGTAGTIIGMRTFGASAPLKELQKVYGFTVDNVIAAAGSHREGAAAGSRPQELFGPCVGLGRRPLDGDGSHR